MTVITTSTSATATDYSNQRKIDRCSNGVLWTVYSPPAVISTDRILTSYSTDNGATWSQGTPIVAVNDSSLHVPNASLFIDLDDYAHVVYKDKGNGYIYYRRGTPNAGRTAWTWSAATSAFTDVSFNFPDVVAHREGTGWRVHTVCSRNSSSFDSVYYDRLDIDAAGVVTRQADVCISATTYSNTIHKWPSIDFNHTGDGKTVAGGAPHLYVGWSAGAAGAGKGIRFRKATYSAGTWTWGTEREIDSGQYVGASYFLNCLFDGTRVVIAGSLDGTVAGALCIYDRDAADTTTTVQYRVSGGSAANFNGSATYDSLGNIYLLTQKPYSGTADFGYYKWTRATTTLGTRVVVDSTIPDASTRSIGISAKRGYSGSRIEFIYTDGTASPYNVTYDKILLNIAPTVTVTPSDGTVVDPRFSQTISWTYSDPESDPQVSFSASVKESTAAPQTWASGATAQTGTINTFTAPVAGVYTIEAIGAAGGTADSGQAGGKGARVVGDFSLAAGEIIKVIAGKPGQKPTESTRGGGGGGASWVYKTGASQPMLVAGGGGGGGNYTYNPAAQDASLTTSGLTGGGSASGNGTGGTGGNGGGAGTYGSGGAGWLTNGTSASSTTGGATPANGAGGGNAFSTTNGWGGFGGGGGAYAGAGGGAGYSGGGAGGWSSVGYGGGGGSYNAGTNQIMQAGIGTDQGSVTITQFGVVVFSTSGTTQNSFAIPANSMTDEKTYTLTLNVSEAFNTVTKTQSIIAQSWIYGSEVSSSAASGNVSTTGLVVGEEYEIQVRTADAAGYGPWSSSAVTFITNVMAYIGGTWKASRKQFRHWSEGWRKDQGTTKF